MKKYILLFALSCLISSQIKAGDTPQDSVKSFIDKIDIEMQELDNKLAHLDLSLNIDSICNLAMNEGLKGAMEEISNMTRNIKVEINSSKKVDDKDDGTPTRTEKMSFSNIDNIEISHSYGNIILNESASKQVEIEVQYFDTKTKKANCSVTTTGKLLTINTERNSSISKQGSSSSFSLGSLRGSNGNAKINYIISIPRNISLMIDLKYGNIKMDKFSSSFFANLSYSNLSAISIVGVNPQIKAKYSEIKIDETKNINLSSSYSDIRIKRADKIEIAGNYNDYVFGSLHSLSTIGSTAYGDIRITTVGDVNADLKYTDIVIDNLLANLDITTAYGDIDIRNVSANLKNINVKASYADLTVSLPQNLGASLSANLSYGDMIVLKKYDVRYSESIEKGSKVIKKGQIGSKTPTAVINISGSYGDVRIK